ncbi:hypothetical protein RP20_CCG025879 [Aedes albopictus]|nr:uncharacterized protein LOC109622551 [Aedes albopictus]KXJ80267.1 hypothetical protein RP20_CCG025879 [Aedes albopictus]
MYHQRFVLTTLMRLPLFQGNLADDEDFRRDLTDLRNMAIDKNVVLLLLRHEVVELILRITETSADNQLVVILLGMVRNMCCVEETHRFLYDNETLLLRLCGFLNSNDPLVLEQMMKIITTILEQSNDEYFWFQMICEIHGIAERLAYILRISTSRDLLESTMEAVHAMAERFTETEVDYFELDEFYELFGKTCLIEGLMEGFKQLYPDTTFVDHNLLVKEDLKIINKFLDIHENFIINAEDVYEDQIENVLECFYRVLVPISAEACLIPLYNAHARIIVRINELCSDDNVRQFHAGMYRAMLKIFTVLSYNLNDYFEQDQRPHEAMDLDEDDHDDYCPVENQKTLQFVLGYLYHVAQPIPSRTLANVMKLCSPFNEEILRRLCAALQYTMDGDPLLGKTCNLLMESAWTAWNDE